MPINAPTPILNLPVAPGVDGTYWVPTASTNGSPTERVNVLTLSSLQSNLDQISTTQGAILYRNASQWVALDPGTSGFVLSTGGPNANPSWISGSAGSVTSVGLSLPSSVFSISGSPVTSTGTLTGDLIAQNANKVFAGPTTGADATPTFRGLVNADISSIGAALTKTDDTNVTATLSGSPSTALVNATNIALGWTGLLGLARGGTNADLSGTGGASQVLRQSSTGASITVSQLAASDLSNGTTGTGAVVLASSPTLTTPALGTPSALTLTNATSLPLSSGVMGQLPLANGGTAANLTDPGADSILFWDDSNGKVDWLSIGANLSITGTTLNATGGGGGTDIDIGSTVITGGSTGQILYDNGGIAGEYAISGTGSVAMTTSPAFTTPNLGTPSAATLTNATGLPVASGISGLGTGIATFLATPSSANLAAALTDETGSGAAVFATSPTLVTPDLGTPGSGVLTNCTGTASGLTAGHVTTNANLTGPITSTGNATAIASQTGTGTKFVMDTSPTLVTPNIGTPSSGTLTSCTGLPISTGVSGLGTGVATFLATPSSANLKAAVTDETGSGALVFATSPTLVTPALGTPSSGTLTSCTGLPISTGVSGLGSGVATMLATFSSANIASACTDETGSGALVFGTSPTLVTPALGTPASGTLTSCTGLPISTGVSGLGTGVATMLASATGAVVAVTFVIDGGGSVLTTGVAGDLYMPFSGTITSWTLLADQSGSVVVNIWMDTYANYPPTVADKITASAPPTISSAVKGQSSTLTGWTTAIPAGDTLRFNIDSVTTITRVVLTLTVTKT